MIKTSIQLIKNDDNAQFIDHKKITISTAKKKDKTYRTYQININQEYIKMLLNDDLTETTAKRKIALYLIEKNKQHYEIKETINTYDNAILTNTTLTNKKNTSPLTLPKNEMPYIKAYDEYLKAIDNLKDTNKFEIEPLNATITLIFAVENNELKIKLNIKDIKADIKKDFIEYLKAENKDTIPEWLNILITNWQI